MNDDFRGGVLGRAVPLRRLADVVSASAQGRAATVLVSGEAGIGKTSLIRAALDESSADLTVSAWGTCWHSGGAPGFWPWMQAFTTLTAVVGADEAAAAAGHDADILSLLIRDFGPPTTPAGDLDRHRLQLLDAAARWLESLAAQRHVAVVLDDLQWADSSTFDLLDYLVATPRSVRLLVIGAFRHDELDHERRARLAAIASHANDVHLSGLTVDGVEDLIRDVSDLDASREVAIDLHRRTGGHPLFVRELARLSASDDVGTLPTAVTGAVTRRLDAFPIESRRLLDVASVLGNRLLLDVLGAVVGEPTAVVLDRLSTAIDAGVVKVVAGDEFWFTHDLYRETIYAELDAVDRSALHERIGAALEARRGRGGEVSPGDVAGHYAQAIGAVDPANAIRWAEEAAADDRRRLAFSEAAGHLRRVRMAVVDRGGGIEPDVLTRLLVSEADNQARSGRPDVARDLLRQASRAAPGAEDVADVALAVQRLGAKFSAPRDEIIAHLETALLRVTGVSPRKQAQLTAALARELQHSVAKDRHRAGPLSEEALTLGRQSGDDETIAACLLARHDALWVPGTGAARAGLGHEIATIGARLGDVDRESEGLILEANGLLEAGQGHFRSVLGRWFELLSSRNEPHDRYMIATRHAAIALLDGDLDRGERVMHEAAALGEQINEPDTGNVLMSQRVALASARRDPDELRTLAADAVSWWTGAAVFAHAIAAGALANAGDLDAARREVTMVAASGDWRREGSYLRSVLVGHLAVAAIAIDDLELCRRLLADIEDITDSCGVNGAVVAFVGPFAHTAGILSTKLGNHEDAAAMLERSIDIAGRLGADEWVRRSTTALRAVEAQESSPAPGGAQAVAADDPTLIHKGGVWLLSWRHETGTMAQLKGLADIAVLVEHRGQEVPALHLAGGHGAPVAGGFAMIDRQALTAYRDRLDDLDAEIDAATRDVDIGRTELLQSEREQVLAEIKRSTGLGGRIRSNANDPAERARKAVTARIRDAIGRLDEIMPDLAGHLNRSIRTGVNCSYAPEEEEGQTRRNVEL